jgi:hypothetical protein
MTRRNYKVVLRTLIVFWTIIKTYNKIFFNKNHNNPVYIKPKLSLHIYKGIIDPKRLFRKGVSKNNKKCMVTHKTSIFKYISFERMLINNE